MKTIALRQLRHPAHGRDRWPWQIRLRVLVSLLALLPPLSPIGVVRTPAVLPLLSPNGVVRTLAEEPGALIGLASGALDCLRVNGDQPASGQVTLNWPGQPERARLIVWIAGAEAGHTIRVNGRAVARTPVFSGGEPCHGEPFYLDLPPAALTPGANTIAFTNDGWPNDSWTAAHVRLEVFGRWEAQAQPAANLAPNAPLSMTVSFTNSYDLSTQEARVQVPGNYHSGVPTPLVIYVHGRSSDMYEPALPSTQFDVAANNKGWLLASPQLHGRWPGTTEYPIPNPPGKYAYASLHSQYDIIGTLQYMLDNYNIKRDQVYLVGNSMGGQIATVMAAKYPHLFAAVSAVKPPTDFAQWYDETSDGFHRGWMRRECYTGSVSNPVEQRPDENPFCYARRSSQPFASNYLHVPITLTHSLADTLVPVEHSLDLRDAINSNGPDQTAAVLVDTVVGPTCGEPYHCYLPSWPSILAYLSQYTLGSVPLHVHVISDQSKPFYWLNLTQTGNDHWSQVEATANPSLRTVTLTVTDPQPLTLRLNLGTSPRLVEAGFSQPGLGFPAGVYRVQGAGLNALVNYTSGYLTLNLPATAGDTITVTPYTGVLIPLYLPFVRR